MPVCIDDVSVRSENVSSSLGLVLRNFDHFKLVNDSHGHLIGDEVLRALATELRQQVRESDVVGRSAARSSPCCCRAPTAPAPTGSPNGYPRHGNAAENKDEATEPCP